jgi:IclR family acetate operon transcriptional repressor
MTTLRVGGRTEGVQSIDRAVAILRCFGARTPTMGISEIARATGLTTSTTHRLLSSLQHNRLVRQTANRQYALGPLLMQLVASGAVPTTLRDAALGVMRALRDEIEETVGLHELLPTLERQVVDQVESHHALRRTYTEIGVPIPLPHGAPGKVLLAFLPHAMQETVLATPPTAVTPTTITDVAELARQFAAIRDLGYAMSFAERTPGIRTVAAPIFDHSGTVTACLSLTGPEMRMPRERMLEVSAPVKAAAWEVSEALGATAEGVQRSLAAAGPTVS